MVITWQKLEPAVDNKDCLNFRNVCCTRPLKPGIWCASWVKEVDSRSVSIYSSHVTRIPRIIKGNCNKFTQHKWMTPVFALSFAMFAFGELFWEFANENGIWRISLANRNFQLFILILAYEAVITTDTVILFKHC